MADEYQEYQTGGKLKESEILFPVAPLHIQLDTNVDGVKLFKRSMIKLPKTSRVPLLTSEFPFFTRKVQYPSSIQNEPWQSRYEFFFNRDIFIDRLRKAIVANKDLWLNDKNNTKSEKAEDNKPAKIMAKNKRERELEIHNIMITLRSIFPVREVFRNALKNTYQHVLNAGPNSRVVFDMSIKSAVNVFGFMYKFGIMDREKSDYFINLSGKRYLVEDVTWENDMVNHPEYFKFLQAYHNTFEEVGKSKDDVKEKLDGFIADLDKQLSKMSDANFAIPEFYDWVVAQKAENYFDINYNPKNIVPAPTLTPDEKKSIAIKRINSFQIPELEKKIQLSVSEFGKQSGRSNQFNKEAPLVKLLYKHYYCKTSECNDPKWAEVDSIDISAWGPPSSLNKSGNAMALYDKWTADASLQGAMIKKLAETLKNSQVTMQTILYNLISNKPASTDDRNADRAAANDRIAEKLKRLFGQYKLVGEAAANTIIAIQLDAEDHQAIKSGEDMKVFINGEYFKAFGDLLRLAVQVSAASIVYKFASQYVPMILTDKQLDGTDERPIIKRRNKFIRDNFGTEAGINNDLTNSVTNVFEPIRKTSNTELYKLLKRIKVYTPPDPYETDEQRQKREKESEVFRHIYEKYISTYKVDVDETDIDDYLYTGVEEVKTTGTESQDKNEKSDVPRNAQEIYVRLDLIDADKMRNTPKAPCKYYDKMLENEYLYLTDKRNKGVSRLSKYRDFTFDMPNPLSELAMVAAAEAKSKMEEDAEKKQKPVEPPAVKTGGNKYSRKNRREIRNRTLSLNR